MDKFGVRVLEGYGVTECSPAISANIPMHSRPGSAGRLLPGIEYRLEPVDGITHSEPHNQPPISNSALGAPPSAPSTPPSTLGALPALHSVLRTPHSTLPPGRLFLRGPNVMRGYLNEQANGGFKALGGWYDTGDIARVDPDGFLFILGRLKRFAKVSGEMVSLASIEEALAGGFPQYGQHFCIAVEAIPDATRGEKIVAVANEGRLTLTQVREAVQRHGLSNLAVPRELKIIKDLPRLGSGKIDHRALQQLLQREGT